MSLKKQKQSKLLERDLPELPAYLQELVDAVSLVIQQFQTNMGELSKAIEGKLDKDGQSADSERLGGQLPSYYAEKTHGHDEYAEINHGHDEYAEINHGHDGEYAEINHGHDEYAEKTHDHDGEYLGLNAKADSAKSADKATHADDADTVNGKTVAVSVPAGAKFTDTHRDVSDSVTSQNSNVSASSKAVSTVNTKVEDALSQISDLEGEMVGQFKHLGGIDLSGGKYPPKPDFSAIWHVQVGGNVDATTHVANASTRSSMEYEEGDSLVFSIDLDMFYKVKDKASISSDEVYDKFLQKTGKAADTGKVDGKDARYVNHGTDIRGMIAGSLNETPERGGFVDGTDGSANPTGNRSIGFQAVGSGGTRMFQLISPTVNTEVWFRSKHFETGDWRGWGRFFSTLDKPKVDDVSGLKGELDKKSNTGHGHSDLVKKSGDTMTGNLLLNEAGVLPLYSGVKKPDDSAGDYPGGISVSTLTEGSADGWPTSHTTILTVKGHATSTTRMWQILGDSNSSRLYWRSAHNKTDDPGLWKPFSKIYHEGDKPTPSELGAADATHKHDDYAAKTHNHDGAYLGKSAKAKSAEDADKLGGQLPSHYATASGLAAVKKTADGNAGDIAQMQPELEAATEITGDLVLLCAHLTDLLNDAV